MSGAHYQTNNGQSGAIVQTRNRAPAPAEVLRGELVRMMPEFQNALPSHIRPERFQRVVMTVVQQQPGLLTADRKSLLASCLKCAADGLIPDGREAALVMFGQQVQYMPMMAGIQKRVRNSGEIASVEAHVIHEHDRFVWRQGVDSSLIHEPKFPGDRGRPIGAYAVAKFKDGSVPMFEVMDYAEIERVRAVSRAKNSGPWVTWWGEMARKTVFRRLSKWLPMDADVDDLLRREDEPAALDSVPIETARPASKLDALEWNDDATALTEDAPATHAPVEELPPSPPEEVPQEPVAQPAGPAYPPRMVKWVETTEVKFAAVKTVKALYQLIDTIRSDREALARDYPDMDARLTAAIEAASARLAAAQDATLETFLPAPGASDG